MINRYSILQNIYYNKGKQATNFKIFHNYKKKDGDRGFSKWVPFLEATKEDIQQATHRTLLINEIVLDFDPEKGEDRLHFDYKVKTTCNDLRKKGVEYECYSTGSRGYHIHIWLKDMFFMGAEDRKIFRTNICRYHGAELQKNSENVPIALEGVEHFKSGKIKERCDL